MPSRPSHWVWNLLWGSSHVMAAMGKGFNRTQICCRAAEWLGPQECEDPLLLHITLLFSIFRGSAAGLNQPQSKVPCPSSGCQGIPVLSSLRCPFFPRCPRPWCYPSFLSGCPQHRGQSDKNSFVGLDGKVPQGHSL